jgi:hypothetical protein
MRFMAIFSLFGIVVFALIACAAPFAKKRIRTRWAKVVLVMIGLFGAADCTLSLLREMHWFSLGFPKMDIVLLSLDGLVLGLFVTLALKRQLFGKKRTEDAPPT